MSVKEILTQRIETPEELVAWVGEAVEREKIRNRAIWLRGLKNLLAFHGEDTKIVSDDLRITERLSRKGRKELDKISVNFLSPHVRTMVSKLQRAKPILECVPSTSDDIDVLAAKVGDRLLKGEWYSQQMDSKRTGCYTWVCSTGDGYLHQYFDSQKGQPVDKGVFTGEIMTEVLNPFKVFLEPHRTNIVDCRWVIIRSLLPRDQVICQYEPIYFARTKRMLDLPANAPNDDVSDVYLQAIGLGETTQDDDFVQVDTVYHVPTKWYPNGRYALLCGSEVLYEGPYPYAFLGRLPITHWKEIDCPWRLHGETSSTEVLNGQENYLRIRKIERDYHLDNLASKWFRPKGCRVTRKALTSRDSRVIDFAGDKKPSREAGLNIPGSIYNSIELYSRELERMGFSSATMSQDPGSSSGRAILALQEQDDVRLGLTSSGFEPVFSQWGQNVLLMAKNFYKEERKYKISGDALAGAVWAFDASDLGETTDVRCVQGSAMPTNKLARQETVMTWFDKGILGQGEEAIVRVRKMLEMGSTEDMYDDDALDEQVAVKENMAMMATAKNLLAQGIQDLSPAVMPVSLIDNALVHKKVHLRQAKAPGVRDNLALLSVIVLHIQQHDAPPPVPAQPGQAPGQAQEGVTVPPPENAQAQNQQFANARSISEGMSPKGGIVSNDLNRGDGT